MLKNVTKYVRFVQWYTHLEKQKKQTNCHTLIYLTGYQYQTNRLTLGQGSFSTVLLLHTLLPKQGGGKRRSRASNKSASAIANRRMLTTT